jgi:hypothetical protein
MKERLPAGDGNDRGSAFQSGCFTFLRGHHLFEDVLWIGDLSTSLASKVAAEQWLQHEDQWKPAIPPKFLPEDIGADTRLLNQRYAHNIIPIFEVPKVDS